MSNNEFAEEFSRRSAELFSDQDTAQRVLDEFDTLDPREALLVHRALSQSPDSVEFLHTKTRISALVASGAISTDLATLATMEKVTPPDDEEQDIKYMYSRLALLEELSDSHNSVIDPTGLIYRMVERGDSKEKVIEALNKSTVYSTRAEAYEENKDSEDIAAQVANFQFKSFMEAVDGLLDPAEAPDFGVIAKEMVAKYDEDGLVAAAIDSGAKAEEVFKVLDNSDAWIDAYRDYSTRDDIDTPRIYQLESWGHFKETVKAIKDLDYR